MFSLSHTILILGLTSFYSFTQSQNFWVALLISIKIDKNFHLYFYSVLFVLLFSPIFLILFKEFYFYSELSSIRNSRVHAWSDDHFNWNSLASIMIQEVCSSRLESFSSNNKQRIFFGTKLSVLSMTSSVFGLIEKYLTIMQYFCM